jgi:hypothetical protein
MAAKRNYGRRQAAILGRIFGLIFTMITAGLNGCGTGSAPTPLNPVPAITSVSPNTILPGSGAFTLKVNGSNFNRQSAVQWNDGARITTYVSASQLQAAITATDVSVSGTASITVVNPAPGGGSSRAQAFTIPAIVLSISPASVTLAAEEQQQFTATVSNSKDIAVTWQVDGITGGSADLGTISASGLYNGNALAKQVTITAISQADSMITATAQVIMLAPHSIAVRPVVGKNAEFYTVATGTAFVPRGNNYVRLAAQTWGDGTSVVYHSTFNEGLYNPAQIETALTQMQQNGYNVARVWLNGCCHDNTIGDPAGGLSQSYISNVIDFLAKAKAHGIQVVFTLDSFPSYGGYESYVASCGQFGGNNLLNLCKGGVEANVAFFHDFLEALIDGKASLDTVLTFEIRNEYFYESATAPLSWTSGTVTTANGQTYDMADAFSRQKMMDDGMVFFSDQTRQVIRALDPTALVDIGFFAPQGPNPTRVGDERVIEVYPAIATSHIDFVSIHPYPLPGDLTFDQYAQNFGFTGYQQQKPVVMDEFGAYKSDYPDISAATSVLENWQLRSCQYDVKGWMPWSWDTEAPEEIPAIWAAVEDGGAINKVLAPVSRPDPCKP